MTYFFFSDGLAFYCLVVFFSDDQHESQGVTPVVEAALQLSKQKVPLYVVPMLSVSPNATEYKVEIAAILANYPNSYRRDMQNYYDLEKKPGDDLKNELGIRIASESICLAPRCLADIALLVDSSTSITHEIFVETVRALRLLL